MVWVSNLTIKNTTDYPAKRMKMSSEHMDQWGFPEIIPAQQSVDVNIYFEESLWEDPSHDKGFVSYEIPDKISFEISAFVNINCFLTIGIKDEKSKILLSPTGNLVMPRNSHYNLLILELKDHAISPKR